MPSTQLLEASYALHEQRTSEQHAQQLAGSVALKTAEAEHVIIRPPLPEGYYYDESDDVADKGEIADLIKIAGLLNAPTRSDLEADATWNPKLGIHKLGVGVRAPSGVLVGYGALLYKDGVGEMGGLAVLPEHRGQGIGTAIIDSRIQAADALGLASLFIEGLQDTNGLREHYDKAGFRELSGGALGKGDNPRRIEL